MEFEISYYKDGSGKLPVEEFLLALGKTNEPLQAKAFKGIQKLLQGSIHSNVYSFLEKEMLKLKS